METVIMWTYADVRVGITQYDSKITHHLSFGRGSSSKEPGEMPGDDLQGSRPSYATHSCNSKSFSLLKLEIYHHYKLLFLF